MRQAVVSKDGEAIDRINRIIKIKEIRWVSEA
jgi:hypothetical protein